MAYESFWTWGIFAAINSKALFGILKAAEKGYVPKLEEAKTAQMIMEDFVDEIKNFLATL